MADTKVVQNIDLQSKAKFIPLHPPAKPHLSPQFKKALEKWLAWEKELHLDEKELQKFAAMLTAMKNPMYGVQEIMMMFQNIQGDQIGGLSAVDDLDSDIRSSIGAGQSATNSMGNGDGKNGNEVNYAKKLLAFVKELQGFIAYERAQGKNSVVGPAVLNNLQSAINSIKATFTNDWGNPKYMAEDYKKWVNDSKKKGAYSANLTDIQNGFHTLTQSASTLSATTGVALNFKEEEFKQGMGMQQDAMESLLMFFRTIVNNGKTN